MWKTRFLQRESDRSNHVKNTVSLQPSMESLMDISVNLLYLLGVAQVTWNVNDILKGIKTELESLILLRYSISFGSLAEMSELQVRSWRRLLAVVYESFIG